MEPSTADSGAAHPSDVHSTAADPSGADAPGVGDLVDPRAPRFGQSITALATGAFVATGRPEPLFAVAAILAVSVLSGWRVDLYAVVWRRAVAPIVGPPDRREPAAPHRFAKLLAMAFTLGASVLFVAGSVLPAMVVAGLVAVLAGVAAAFDVCVGCRMDREVSYVRRLGVV
jgi:hypothetical protein